MPDIEQGQHGHHAALAVVVGAHDQDGVLERDNQDQRPEDERDGAGDALRRQCAAGVGGLFEGIKRACADVAVHDPERGEGGTRECWRTRVAGSRDWMRMLGHVSALPAMGSVTENAGEANQERGPDQRLVGTDRVCLALRFGGTSGF